MTKLTLFIVALLAVGCAQRTETIKTTRITETRQSGPVTPAVTLDSHADRIANAPDSLAEAQALREWVEHLRRRNYTYDVKAFQAGTDQRVAGASMSKLPLRVEIKVYRADQKLEEFSFIPKENENLTIIAKDL